MGFIQFAYKKKFGYSENKISDFGFQMFGMLVAEEIGIDASVYKEWLKDAKVKAICGNLVCIRKENNSLVVHFSSVMDVTDEQRVDWILELNSQDADDEFNISVKDFLHVIDHWAKVRKMWFKEIWIKCENGVYWVEGVDPMG